MKLTQGRILFNFTIELNSIVDLTTSICKSSNQEKEVLCYPEGGNKSDVLMLRIALYSREFVMFRRQAKSNAPLFLWDGVRGFL